MGARLLTAAVGLAALLSAVLLGVMLAAPLLPGADARLPALIASPGAEASATDAEPGPPVGLFLLRGTLDFGPCLAMELGQDSYPASADAAPGAATILSWESGIVDPGHPDACATRSSHLEVVDALVTRLTEDEDPDGRLIGYAIAFQISVDANVMSSFEIAILLARSTDDLIQAVVTNTPGGPLAPGAAGLVFDGVEEVDPRFQPLPSASPTPAFEPTGLYLLRGPFTADGPCLVLVLGAESYPTDPSAAGVATVRWWERGGTDPNDPAACLSRRGEVQQATATVVSLRIDDDLFTAFAYVISFSVPVGVVMQDVRIEIPLEQSTEDQLPATVVTPEDIPPIAFDRVDSIDPPLAPAPSP